MMGRDLDGDLDPFDRLSGKTPERQIADQELIVEKCLRVIDRTRNRAQDLRDMGAVDMFEGADFDPDEDDRHLSRLLDGKEQTLDWQLDRYDRQARKLQRMQAYYDKANRAPSPLKWADFVDEWGQTR